MSFVDTKDPGKLNMSGRVNLGVPRNKILSKSGSIAKQDTRGKGEACIKKG